MSGLVTGDAVVLELGVARLPSRALAVLIDLLVTVSIYLAGTVLLVSATSSLDEAARAAVSVAALVLLLVGLPIAVETLSHGRSLGKAICGLRVVRDDGGPIRFRHALVRGAVAFVEILLTFGVIAMTASLVSARGRRLGDVFAGTLVVRERVPTMRRSALPAPPDWLAEELRALDLSSVPDGLWLAVRQYTTRARQLDPQVSHAMAERLALDLSACTGVAVPPGVPPAGYLAGVVAERQAREAQRAFGSAAPAPAAGRERSEQPQPPPPAGPTAAAPGAGGGTPWGPGFTVDEAAGRAATSPAGRSPEGPAGPAATGFAPPA
ncbi:RDD family protein [Streptomyces sp. TP-A0874]|uniref:RDD family protein n=1 Tax=Streptomyces sp. TP-A0874 TaxID=549819 RepID=UPI000852F109|nr:RDD family protein [Streptomyces sp. TP-A0874]